MQQLCETRMRRVTLSMMYWMARVKTAPLASSPPSSRTASPLSSSSYEYTLLLLYRAPTLSMMY